MGRYLTSNSSHFPNPPEPCKKTRFLLHSRLNGNTLVRTYLRIAAILVAVVITAVWFCGGPNLKWTKNRVGHQEKDPVTELEVTVYEDRFVPGVDFLGAGLFAASILAGVSFFFKKSIRANSHS